MLRPSHTRPRRARFRRALNFQNLEDRRVLAAAVDIPIINSSFEQNLDVGWIAEGTGGIYNPTPAQHSPVEAPHGNQVVSLASGTLRQTLGEPLLADQVYELQVNVGDAFDSLARGFEVELLAGDHVLASAGDGEVEVAEGGYATLSVQYDSVSSAAIGQPLEVRVRSAIASTAVSTGTFGHIATSPNGNFALIFEANGDLVLRDIPNNRVVWSTGTAGAGASRVVVQSDGNFVLYPASGPAVWHTYTFGHPGARVLLSDAGTLDVVSPLGTLLWSTHGTRVQYLAHNDEVESPSGQFLLKLQTDGNLVIFDLWNGGHTWTSRTHGTTVTQAIMQPDGNFVLYTSGGIPLWQTRTGGHPDAKLVLTNSGRLEVRVEPFNLYWRSHSLQNRGVAIDFDNISLRRRETSTLPVAADDTFYHTPQNTDLVVDGAGAFPTVLANDTSIDSPIIDAQVVAYPQHGNLTVFGADGSFIYQPDLDFSGIDSFEYYAINSELQRSRAQVSIAVGTPLLARQNLDANVFNSRGSDPWLQESVLDPTTESAGLGTGGSNIPEKSSAYTEGGLATTGGLQLIEDVAQDVALIYRSDSLSRPIIAVATQLAPGAPLPTAMSAQLTFNGVAGAVYDYDVSQLIDGQPLRFVIQADGTGLPTGMYDYELAVITTTAGQSRTQSFTGKQAIVNRSGSEFGNGWGLDDLDRLFTTADGALIVRGNGDSLWFPVLGDDYAYAAGDTSRSRLVENPDGSFDLFSKYGLVSSFSALGLLQNRQDANGNTITFTYADKNGDSVPAELTTITDAFGRDIDLQYDGGHVSSIVHYSGKTTTLSHQDSYLTQYVLADPDGAAGPKASPAIALGGFGTSAITRTNAVGDVTTYHFNSDDGRLRSVVFPDGGDWKITPIETVGLVSVGMLNSISTPDEAIASIVDQERNQPDPTLPIASWTLRTDRFGGITESTTAKGHVRTYLRNADGLVYKVIEPDPDEDGPLSAPVTHFAYNAASDLTLQIAADGGKTYTSYTPDLHRVRQIVDPVGRAQSFAYDLQGNMLSSTDGAGFTTSFTYWPQGLLKSTTQPDPDGSGPLTSPVTSYSYDSLGRIARITNPDLSIRGYTYNSADFTKSVQDELGNFTFLHYDALDRLDYTTDRVQAETHWEYDAASRVIESTDARQQTTTTQYNSRGWVEQITFPDPDGAGPLESPIDLLLYDLNGNLTRQNDPRGNFEGQIEYGYDSDNQRTQIGSSVDSRFEIHHYDPLGRLEHVERVPTVQIDSNPTTEDPTDAIYNEYDALGRLTKRISRPISSTTPSALWYSEEFEYNAAGELVKRIDGLGNVSTNEYDGRGLLVRETLPDPDGNGPQFPLVVRYAYDGLGRMTETDRGFDRRTRYEYNPRGWVTRVTEPDPDGNGPKSSPVTQFVYSARGDQTVVIDPLNRATHFIYDAEQRLSVRVDPDPDGPGPQQPPVTRWNYNEMGWLSSVEDAVGAITSYSYDGLGRIETLTDPDPDGAGPLLSPITQYVYGDKGLQNVIDPRGATTTYQRDNRGRIIEMTDAAQVTTVYDYDYYDNLVKETLPDPDGNGPLVQPITLFEYDPYDRLTFKRERTGETEYASTGFTYDSASNLHTVTDPSLNVTTYGYDNLNRKTVEIDPAGNSRTYTYNVAGNLTKTVDRNGKVVQYVYDALDRRIVERWQPTSKVEIPAVVRVEKGAFIGEVQELTRSGSTIAMTNSFQITHDGQVAGPFAWDATATTIQSGLEALPNIGAGNIQVAVEITPDQRHQTITLTFAGAKAGQDLPQTYIDSNVSPFATFREGQRTLVQGERREERQRIEFKQQSGSGDMVGQWYISYAGEVSQPLRVEASPLEVQAALNSMHAIDNAVVENFGSTSYFYVNFGGAQAGHEMQLLQVDRANIAFGDEFGGFEHVIAYNYNAAGELMAVREPAEAFMQIRSTNYTRDNLGRATNITTTYDVWNLSSVSIDQDFDAVGNRKRLAVALDNQPDFVNHYAHDKLGRMLAVVQVPQPGVSWVTPKRVTQAYNEIGQRLNTWRYESATATNVVAATEYTYDSANRLDNVVHRQGGTQFSTYDYTYDALSRLETTTSTLEWLTAYSYDARSQLTGTINTGAPNESYQYDVSGNRDVSTGYQSGVLNETTASPGYTYEYDNEGNMTKKTGGGEIWTYKWDHRNRLIEATRYGGNPSSQTTTYDYDAFNRLIRRGQQRFIYDEGINPLIEFGLGPRKLYLWSEAVDDLLAAESIGSNTLWPLNDHLGTGRLLLDREDSTGITTINNHRRYDTFGNLIYESNPAADLTFGYTGKLFDEFTGLQNNLNRWYDPNLGKWISQDPIGFNAGDANLYRYVGNGPTNSTDPSGNVVVFVHGINTENDEEANAITAALNQYWDDNGIPRQEVIHFRYGTFGALHAWNDTWSTGNARAGRDLRNLIASLARERSSLGSKEPINVLAYSNGSNVAFEALSNCGIRNAVENLIFVGGSIDQGNDFASLMPGVSSLHSFSSKRTNGPFDYAWPWAAGHAGDWATQLVDGVGGQGIPQDVLDENSWIVQHWVENVYHSRGEPWKWYGPNGGSAWSTERQNAKLYPGNNSASVSATWWLTQYMVLNHYSSLLSGGSDRILSNFGLYGNNAKVLDGPFDTSNNVPCRSTHRGR